MPGGCTNFFDVAEVQPKHSRATQAQSEQPGFSNCCASLVLNGSFANQVAVKRHRQAPTRPTGDAAVAWEQGMRACRTHESWDRTQSSMCRPVRRLAKIRRRHACANSASLVERTICAQANGLAQAFALVSLGEMNRNPDGRRGRVHGKSVRRCRRKIDRAAALNGAPLA